MRVFLMTLVLCHLSACADTDLMALEKAQDANPDFQNYEEAAQYLADKSGVIAICRAALEIEKEKEKDLGYEQQHCGHVLEQSALIKQAASLWMSASKAEQNRWFEKNPYGFREMLNALSDYDTIVQHIHADAP